MPDVPPDVPDVPLVPVVPDVPLVPLVPDDVVPDAPAGVCVDDELDSVDDPPTPLDPVPERVVP